MSSVKGEDEMQKHHAMNPAGQILAAKLKL